jgi:oligopeptide/dipeptide ABC transporter ATP-binding protein
MSDATMTDVAPATADVKPLLAIEGLVVEFASPNGERFRASDGVSLTVAAGEVVAVVGESGSGKSVTARAILRLVPHPGRIRAGKITFQGRDILRMPREEVRRMRGREIAMVFQDPMSSLNPVLRVGAQIGEAIGLHSKLTSSAIGRRVLDLLRRVGIPATSERARSFPHEYSGGMRQRAMIAMGVANSPALLIADEPTTALDVTIQDQIITLMRDLNRASGTAVLLITHNVALVASLCTRVLVMYAGRIIEEGPTAEVFRAPQHPYTWSLLRSVPRVDGKEKQRLLAIKGQPPNPRDLPAGCKFEPRCPFAVTRCREAEPALERIGAGRAARCFVMMKNVEAPA